MLSRLSAVNQHRVLWLMLLGWAAAMIVLVEPWSSGPATWVLLLPLAGPALWLAWVTWRKQHDLERPES